MKQFQFEFVLLKNVVENEKITVTFCNSSFLHF